MTAARVIPVLQIDKDGWMVKTRSYGERRYLGDPVNAVKIFNEKRVDELIVIDIDASRGCGEINYPLLEDVVSEAFMPVAYGGGLGNAEAARRIVNLGIEKVVVNSVLAENPGALRDMATILGSQSVVASIDVRRLPDGSLHPVYRSATKQGAQSIENAAREAVRLGAGELVVSAVDREGTRRGYDLDAIKRVAEAVDVPVVALGGAGTDSDFFAAVRHGASAVAAGSRFAFIGRREAVLINYVDTATLQILGATV